MPFWRRQPRAERPSRADDDDRTWVDPGDPFAHIAGPLYNLNNAPQAYEPKGPAEVFDDEIDPEWRDEDTAED